MYTNCMKTSRKHNWENIKLHSSISKWKERIKHKISKNNSSSCKFLLLVMYKLIQNLNNLIRPSKQSLVSNNTNNSKINNLFQNYLLYKLLILPLLVLPTYKFNMYHRSNYYWLYNHQISINKSFWLTLSPFQNYISSSKR
jgi:hypothetical protein